MAGSNRDNDTVAMTDQRDARQLLSWILVHVVCDRRSCWVYSLLVSFFWLVGVVAQFTLTSCHKRRKPEKANTEKRGQACATLTEHRKLLCD